MGSSKDLALPEDLLRRLQDFGAELNRRRVSVQALDEILADLDRLPPDRIVRAAAQIGDAVSDGFWYGGYVSHDQQLVRRREAAGLLELRPTLGRLLVFHRDGHVRELALATLGAPATSPFAVAAIAYRLNDWAAPVRAAAEDCARRVFPATVPTIIAPAAFALLTRRRDWKRWGAGSTALEEAFFRADVVAELAAMVATARLGPIGRVLRGALERPPIDRHLMRLARTAFLPDVRALAFRCLVEGRASWQVGYRSEWVDKVYGLSRRVPVVETRPVERFMPPEVLIDEAARDRSAMVRRVAADGVVARRRDLPNLDALIALLAQDPSGPVRERIGFVVRERG